MEAILKRPLVVVIVIAAATVFFALQLPRVELDNNNIRFLPDRNEARVVSGYIDDTFGGQVMILVGLKRPYRSVFEKDFLERIREFSKAVELTPFVKSVNSIMSTQYITGDSDSIIVSDLVPAHFSGTQNEITELKRRIGSWDLYRDSLVSGDFSATQILVTLDVLTADSSRPEVTATLKNIRSLAEGIFSGHAEIYITGLPVINAAVNESIIADNLLLIPLVIIVVLGMLFFAFRRMVFVALPLLAVVISVIWTIGMAALAGIKLSVITTILPVILVAVGHSYGVHIVTHYVKDIANKTLSTQEHRLVVFDLMKKMLRPVFLAAVTTITGFLSFCFTQIVPMREFGYCASFGVIAVFIMSVLFIPSMLLLRTPGPARETGKKGKADSGNDRFSSTVANVFLGIARRKALVLVFAAVIVIVTMYEFTKIEVDNSIVDFFRSDSDISRSDRFIREYFGGSKDLNLVVEAATTEELLHPDVMQALDGLSSYLNSRVPDVGKVVGFTDVIKRINQVYNVDQSPEGIKPVVAAHNVNFGFDSFGFGSFGFDEFGFNEFDFNEFNSDNFGSDEFGLNGFDSIAYNDDIFALNDLSRYSAADLIGLFDSASGISAGLSGGDLIRELKRLTNYDGFSYYEIPSVPERYGKTTSDELQRLMANYLFLIAGDDSSGYSDDPLEPKAIRTLIQLRTTGSRDTLAVIETINDYVSANFPQNVRVMIGGSATQEIAVTELILNSQIVSIFISVLMVLLIVAIAHKSLAAGIIGSVPLILAVLCNFALMGFFGIKLNLGTALIASLTVSIGIDDAIHFIEFYKQEYRRSRPANAAEELESLRRTFMACGKAICVTAVSVGAGFGVLAFSQFRIITEMGILIGFSMVSTTLVSLTVIPALLMIVKPRFIYAKNRG